MLDGHEDQAAGLRRLFRRAPPQVVALYACGRHRTHNAVLTAHRIAGHAERVLILDEAEGDAGLGAALALGPGRDLLQVLDGRTTLADVLQPARGLLGRVPTVAASAASAGAVADFDAVLQPVRQVTITAQVTGIFWDSVRWMSPVPGGMSTIR